MDYTHSKILLKIAYEFTENLPDLKQRLVYSVGVDG